MDQKAVKRPGLRKNSSQLQIVIAVKNCLRLFSTSHLSKVRDEFESMYYEKQSIHLNRILKRRETKRPVATQERLALLLVQREKGLEGHQLRIVLLHTSITSG